MVERDEEEHYRHGVDHAEQRRDGALARPARGRHVRHEHDDEHRHERDKVSHYRMETVRIVRVSQNAHRFEYRVAYEYRQHLHEKSRFVETERERVRHFVRGKYHEQEYEDIIHQSRHVKCQEQYAHDYQEHEHSV